MKIKKWLLIALSLFSFLSISQSTQASVSIGFFFQPMPVYDCYYADPWAYPCAYDYYYDYPPVRRSSRCYSEYYYVPQCRGPRRHYHRPRHRVRHRRCCDVWYY